MDKITVFVDGATPGITELERALLGLDPARTIQVDESLRSLEESPALRQLEDLVQGSSQGAHSGAWSTSKRQ
jgi:hypothetical protein